MAAGDMTARVAARLAERFQDENYEVLYDHGSRNKVNVGVIVPWFGAYYNRQSALAQLDIAVITPHSDRVLALVEIEETTAHPKILLGDVLATLLGDHVMFKEDGHCRSGRGPI